MFLPVSTEAMIFGAMKRAVLPLAVVCGWCSDAKTQTARAHQRGFTVSHAMCTECAKRFMDLAGNDPTTGG